MNVLGDFSTGRIKKVTWASYGTHADSWFFAYDLVDGTSTFRIGATIPAALRQFIERISSVTEMCSALRIQLGANDSFVAYVGTSWACYGVPKALEAELCQLSWTYMRCFTVTRGSLKGILSQVTWHGDGSYYVDSQAGNFWHFESVTTRAGWSKLWTSKDTIPSLEELSELVVSVLDSICPVCINTC
jgi:hypothetical protein